MSDHPAMRIFICDDICFDVFRFLTAAKIGLELALVSVRFDAVVDMNFRSRKWTLGELEIGHTMHGDAEIVKLNKDGSSETLPIPHTPLPNNVVGFERISFWSITSDKVIAFLRRIGHLLRSEVTLVLQKYFNEKFFSAVWPLLNVSGIVEICCNTKNVFRRLRTRISPSILCDCTNLRRIDVTNGFPLQFPSDDSAGASDGQALCKWLHTPREDGRPKVLRILFQGTDAIPMEELKAEFHSATAGVSFIIRFSSYDDVMPFQLENSKTFERLTMRTLKKKHWCVMVRSPMDKNAAQWDEWEHEALEEGLDWKVIDFRNE